MPDFVEWRKIFRLHRDFEITEKIDGTNGVIYWVEESDPALGLAEVGGLTVYAGSRNRWLDLDSDNFGFAAWVRDNAEHLRPLGPGYHFGEWMGLGIQRGYGLKDRRFLLFDHKRWRDKQDEAGWSIPVGTVPYLATVNGDKLNDEVRDFLQLLRETGSQINAFPNPEGLVVRHVQSGVRFKVLLDDDGTPKGMTMSEVAHV